MLTSIYFLIHKAISNQQTCTSLENAVANSVNVACQPSCTNLNGITPCNVVKKNYFNLENFSDFIFENKFFTIADDTESHIFPDNYF